MYTARGETLGEFKLKINRHNVQYYHWVEKNYYLFCEKHFWGHADFSDSVGDLTTIVKQNHVKIGYWSRQVDDSIFVYVEQLKQGFVLIKSFSNTPIIYWATVCTPTGTDILRQLALQVNRNLISGNPIIQIN